MFDSSECAWRDLTLFLNGQRVGRFTKLTYEVTREQEHLYGAGDDPFDINPGQKACSGELEAYQSLVNTMNAAARAAGGSDLTDVPWVIVADYKATSISPRTSDTLANVRFEKFSKGGAQNDKAFKSSMTFKCMPPVTTP